MRVSHITSNPKARVLYQRLDILDTLDAALVRNSGGQSINITAEQFGQSNLPFNEFEEHLESLQIEGVADFQVELLHPDNPWYNTVLISNINKNILSLLRRKTRKQLNNELGRTDAKGKAFIKRTIMAFRSINHTVVGLSSFVGAVAIIASWKYLHTIIWFLHAHF